MSESLTLNNALSGLNINQQALTVLSQNIANANTPGYSRQIINQQAVSLDGVGEGVSIASITRKIDDYLTKAVQTQNSSTGQTSTLNDYYSKIQLLLGTPGNNNSIDSYVSNFFDSLQSLSQSPNNVALQQTTVNSGVTVASQINQLSQGLVNLQFQADQDIGSAVTAVNNDLNNIYALNKVIVQNQVLGNSSADLQDQRDSLVKDISQYMDVNTFQKANGSVFLTSAGGVSILDESLYQLSYSPASSAGTFSNNALLAPLTVAPVDTSGNIIGSAVTLSTQNTPSQVTTLLSSGKIAALTSLRDQLIPNITSQLDTMASSLRDQVNAIHNAGSGYPGANSLTGTREVNASDYSQWAGQVRIAVLDSNGQPIASPYADEPNGLAPLTLDLSTLDSGNGPGNPSVQSIIDSINQYYGVPQTKAEVGNLNNIQLISDTTGLPNAANKLSFDFNLDNLSSSSSNFYVTNVAVQDNNGLSMPSSATVPTVALNPAVTYITQAGSPIVSVNTTGASNLTDGETIFLSTPPSGPDAGGSYDGIPASSLGGYFTISNVTSAGFQIQASTAAVAGNSYAVAGQAATPPYTSVASGQQQRTAANGLFTANVSANPAALYYTVTATVGVDDGSGNIKTSQISYQVFNQQASLLGSAFAAQSLTGGGKLVPPIATQALATATLVDANGVELPKVNGKYTTLQSGFLKIQAGSSTSFVAIDSLNSAEQGKPNQNPAVPGTNKGFSDYFDLNDFFQNNTSNTTTNTVTGSALNMAVAQRIQDNNSLLSLGQLTQSPTATTPGAATNFTYQLNPGDNSVVQRLSALSSTTINFAAAGGLGATTQTLDGYIGQIIGEIASNASTATTNDNNAQSLLAGYTQKASAVSGVNLDTELANTVIYQNAYAASARVITVAGTLFDALLQSITP